MDPLPPGSYLAIGDHTADIHPEMEEFARHMSERNPEFRATLRSRAQVTGFFDGLELVPPGVVQISKWRPRSELEARAQAALWVASPASPVRNRPLVQRRPGQARTVRRPGHVATLPLVPDTNEQKVYGR